MKNKTYKLKGEVWLYKGDSPWHFVSLPKKESAEIKKNFGGTSRGWGSLPVSVTVGKTTWRTSIFPNTKEAEYILPLKADVRKKEGVFAGDKISFRIDLF